MTFVPEEGQFDFSLTLCPLPMETLFPYTTLFRSNTGIYVVEREVLDFVPEEGEFDFSLDLFPLLLEKGLPIFGYVTDRFWTDVGTIESYMAAHRAILDGEVEDRSVT